MEKFLRVAWGITGSGSFIRESFEVFRELKRKYPIKITIFLSRAGAEVASMYGIMDRMREISSGTYYEEIITEERTGWSCAHSGRFMLGRYAALFVAPATANTVAKIVYGIADTSITTAVSQAVKGGVPVFILPSDLAEETTVPCHIDREACINCMDCERACPFGAIIDHGGFPYINLLKCHGCEECVSSCPVGAISCFEKARIKIRDVDLENIDKLRKLEGIKVIEDPREIEVEVTSLLKVKGFEVPPGNG